MISDLAGDIGAIIAPYVRAAALRWIREARGRARWTRDALSAPGEGRAPRARCLVTSQIPAAIPGAPAATGQPMGWARSSQPDGTSSTGARKR